MWFHLAVQAAGAQETAAQPPMEAQDFAAALTAAKQSFFRGQHQDAVTRLSALNVRILKGEPVPARLRNETRTWLGEVLFRLGRSDEARLAFRQLLEEDPDWPIDEYQHSVEVVAVFYDVRRQVQAERADRDVATQAPPRRPPAWTLLPFGIAQFIDDRPVAGTTQLILQTALATTSLATFAELDRTNVPEIGHPEGWTEEQIVARQQALRWGVQYPATALLYVASVAGVLEARGHWRRHEVQVTALLDPDAPGIALVVAGRGRD